MNKKIFLSYGAVGLMGEKAYASASKFLREYHETGPPEVLYKYEPYVKKFRKEVARLLSCEPSEITSIKNTTEGINIASEALPLKPGDEILVLGNEYPANLLSWLKKKKDGIRVKVVSGADNEQAFTELIRCISFATKLIAISWAQYYDGYMADLDKLSALCRKHDIYLVVDAVQAVGIRRLDLQKTPVDILVCGGQKYLGAIAGIGFIYVNKNIMHYLRDTKVGVRSMKKFDEYSYELKDTAERFDDGTQNLLGIVALYAAVKEINRIGVPHIERKSLELLGIFKKILRENRIPFIDHARQSNIISLTIDNPFGFCRYLADNNIFIKPVKNVSRISFSHTSTVDEFTSLVEKTREWLERSPQKAGAARKRPGESNDTATFAAHETGAVFMKRGPAQTS